jgi:hypothetical protein
MLDAIFGIDNLRQPNAIALVDEHHFTACNHSVVDTDIERLARDTIQLDDATLPQTQEITNPQ